MAIFNSYFDITRGYPYYPLVLWHGFGRQPFAIGKSSEKGKTNILIRPTVLLLWWCSINCLQFRSSKEQPATAATPKCRETAQLGFLYMIIWRCEQNGFLQTLCINPVGRVKNLVPSPFWVRFFGQDQRRPDGWHNMTLKHPLATNKHYPILPLKIPGSQAIQAIQAPSPQLLLAPVT